jgi:hypothetical protein
MRRHIDRHVNALKEKPEHVRRRVAVGAAGALTGLIAVIWLTAHVTGGSFALDQREPEAADTTPGIAGDGREGFSALLGAVGSSFGATSSQPGLTIVDGNTSTTLAPPSPTQNQTDETVISF